MSFNMMGICKAYGPRNPSDCWFLNLGNVYQDAASLFSGGHLTNDNIASQINQAGTAEAWYNFWGYYDVDGGHNGCQLQDAGFNVPAVDSNKVRIGGRDNLREQGCQMDAGADADGVVGVGMYGQYTAESGNSCPGAGYCPHGNDLAYNRAMDAFLFVCDTSTADCNNNIPGRWDLPQLADGENPWSLIMKIQGSSDQFNYDSAYWEDTNMLNGSANPAAVGDAKYAEWMSEQFDTFAACRSYGAQSNECWFINMGQVFNNAQALFTAGHFTDGGRISDQINAGGHGEQFYHFWANNYSVGGGHSGCSLQDAGFNVPTVDNNRVRFGGRDNLQSQGCQPESGSDADGVVGVGMHGQYTAEQGVNCPGAGYCPHGNESGLFSQQDAWLFVCNSNHHDCTQYLPGQ